MNKKEKRKKMLALYKQMLADDELPLKKQANKLVFGEGNVDTKILFIGEGPGHWEDQKGLPFVGRAGIFLNQLLEVAGLERKKVFITNVVHYRPPNNRDPEPSEIKAFGVYLDKMIKIINPKVMVTLGRFSMAKFLPNVMISNIHGKPKNIIWNGKDIIVVPMYHPAAGLRNGNVKAKTVDDFRDLKGILQKTKTRDLEKKESKKVKDEQMGLL